MVHRGGALTVEASMAAFAFIVQSSDDAIFQLDADGRISSWNRGAARLTGYDEHQALEREPSFLFPEHRQGVEAALLRQALAGERFERRETELQRQSQMLVPVEMTSSPLRAADGSVIGASVIAHDLTEQRLAQGELAASETRLREAQQLASVGMWSWDIATDTVQWSEPLFHILGANPDVFDGTLPAFLDRIAAPDRERVAAALAEAAHTGEALTIECAVGRDRGGPGWVLVRAESVRDSSERIVGLRGIAQDLTERHQADRLKDEFLSTVSHELRTPLTAIVGLTSVLAERDELDPATRLVVDRVLVNAREMHAMVEGILDFSRIEGGANAVAIEPVELKAVVHEVLSWGEAMLADHHVQLDLDPDLVVLADRTALQRILVNLLGNASKFSPAESTVAVSAVTEGPQVVITVRDEGIGIDPAIAERIFERFYQVPDAQPQGKRGTGVGLAIVQRYAELLGGRVWVESELGAGATFRFTMPIEQGSAV